jgi:AcrR family transcriptional regulator
MPPTTAQVDIGENPTLGRRERKKLEVRERILTTAREFFAKNGFNDTTVDEIAEAADVAPATFFNHFHSKQALLDLMTDEVVEYLHALSTQHLEGDGSSQERLRRFIESAVESIATNRDVARGVLIEFIRKDSTPDGQPPYLRRLQQPFVDLIAEGQRRGEIREDHDAAFLAQMVVGMLNSAIAAWLADPEYPVETGVVDATEFVLSTLLLEREGAS